MNSEDLIKTGVWQKDGYKGFGCGKPIDVNGVQYWVTVYQNEKKTDKHPDYTVQLKRAEQQTGNQYSDSQGSGTEDTPF